MLLTEVGANGTALKVFAAAAAIAAGEPEDIVYQDTLGYYLDDGSNAAWVMRHSTFGTIAKLTGDPRMYAETPAGSFGYDLLGYPVARSNKAAAPAASAKSVYFGDWDQVGYREGPELRIIQDPYSVDGLVILKYSFRAVYGVLQAGAIGYGVHPTA
jgi:HK97 family phage major capsid protein